jgi:hypothetical protein
MDNGRIMKELKELQEGVKNVSETLTAAFKSEAIALDPAGANLFLIL